MVKGQMNDNINQAMSNLEDATALNSKADEMKAQSNMFNKQAKTAKNQQWWKNMKVRAAASAAVGMRRDLAPGCVRCHFRSAITTDAVAACT
eukprot:SAG31_NODE_79_length_27235_cov_6.268868_10_plen_92_part_00